MKRVFTIMAVISVIMTYLSSAEAATKKRSTLKVGAPTAAQVTSARKQGKTSVTMLTTKGTIGLELVGTAAPTTVANFLNLVRVGFYNDMPIHRVEPGFVMQAGDPMQKGLPPAGYTIPDERSPLKHTIGVIAMARNYVNRQMVPNSASTQFYITLADTPHLDTLGFTVFGKVISGMDVVQKIEIGDKILKATVGKPAVAKRPIRRTSRR